MPSICMFVFLLHIPNPLFSCVWFGFRDYSHPSMPGLRQVRVRAQPGHAGALALQAVLGQVAGRPRRGGRGEGVPLGQKKNLSSPLFAFRDSLLFPVLFIFLKPIPSLGPHGWPTPS